MRCRECLLTLVRELTQGSDLDEGEDLPKAGDFPPWNERIANAIAPGDPMEYVRGYLKNHGRTWLAPGELANPRQQCHTA